MSLFRTGFVPLPPGAKPGLDHADVYRPRRRIYVAHTGADRIDVLDCKRRAFLRSRGDRPGVAGVLVDEEHDLLYTSDRDAACASVFRCSEERPLGQVEVGPHPNGLAYDRRRRRLYAFNLGEPLGQDCSTSVVELDGMRVVAELPLSGRPRWALYDEERDRAFVNIREPAEIAVIDAEAVAIERACPVPSEGAHGLWLDSGRLFCAADGGALVVLDRDGGEVSASLHLETIETGPGAHTTCWDPVGRRPYVFCPGSEGAALYEDDS